MTAEPDAAPSPAGDSHAPRDLSGPMASIVYVAGIGLSLAHIWFNTFGILPELIRNAAHFAGFGLLCALIFPLARPRKPAAERMIAWIDLAIGFTLVACVAYILVRERAVSGRSFTSGWDFVVATTTILIALEFTRRTTGWIIPTIIVIALTYAGWWGQFLGGSLHFPGLTYETMLQRSIYGEDGMFGTIASISSSFVFMFILFGAFLITSGAGDFIIKIAQALAGRMTGGPGFVAVIGSGLTGTISGSAVANTVSTGVITIPLMKQSGFPPRFAAGVEAASSTGGQLMPPIMGAGAFVMANYTQIPYLQIVAVSFLPALLYFLGIAFYVRIEAKKQGLVPAGGEAPKVLPILKEGGIAFLLPLAVLVGLLVYGFTPTYAAGFAIVSVVVASWLTPNRMGVRKVLDAMALGARTIVLTAMLLVTVGLIVSVIATTGLGNTFSLMIADWAGGSLLVAIILIAIASLVLGMGLPVTAAYIVLATLSAPALYVLITESALIGAVASGNVPVELTAIIGLIAPPDLAAGLGQPMSQADAAALVAMVPPEMTSMVREATLDPAVLTTALLSAHMIIFWLSQDSNVTPPVCLTAFAAAAIAGTRPMATGFTAWKIAKALYVVPLLFAYTPFLSGDLATALTIFGFGTLGLYAIISAIEGHAEASYPWMLRPVMAGIGLALLWPWSLWVQIAGAALLAGFMAWNLTSGRRLAAGRAAG